MEVGRRKRITWESRMKSDELNGGLKIFHGEEENSEESRPETQTGFQRISQTHNKLQSLGNFITVVSYLGLVYLAVIFLFKSIICRGDIGGDDTNQDYVVGEGEAFRAFFCGDPATTMKLAIMLIVLARFGSTITIWKMAKLGEL
ncbi:Reticulon-like protein B21 [Camellia lanceoleosa]|uniref:Reticulon-like protein B21 n=1 Tax=Camellia lanceoleosa TaxID=1840588 RepID=A0ACC0FY33_9ERIC|nr:Reticulon-like protein B21 [Camellia lanceoleosa]